MFYSIIGVMGRQVRFEEVHCARALNRVRGMGFRWSLNPYRGCQHGCHYCFARRYHTLLDLDVSSDFSSIVLVKVNVVEVLRWELSDPAWHRDEVVIGTATDPYQSVEGRYRLTRGCLKALSDRRTPVSLVTKGTMVVRDLDALKELTHRAGATVCFSVTTLRPDLWRALEPGTPPPWQRLRALERLASAGVRAGVLLAPIVPGLTDSLSHLEEVVRASAESGAHFLGADLLRLREGTREHFLGFLREHFPQVARRYERLYPGPYPPRRVREGLLDRVEALKALYRLRARERCSERAERQLALDLV